MAYITEGDLENHILHDIDAGFSAWISTVIGMVESYIEQYTGIDFENDTAGTRYFDGSGEDIQVIGDFRTGTLTSVQILNSDGQVEATLTLNTDFVYYPYNETTPNALKLLSGGQYGSWPARARSVAITGKFGYSSPPAAVKIAAVKLAAKMINEGLKGGEVKAETLGSYSVTYKDLDESAVSLGIKEILNQYRVMSVL